ncbi:MAG: SGNH/GDSL hydrolase family protein [Ruminococcus sp.]|nr:SGNH/GDSL hydrolase family protein [Ruminococcus sp.]
MKKLLALVMALAVAATLFVGCGSSDSSSEATSSKADSQESKGDESKEDASSEDKADDSQQDTPVDDGTAPADAPFDPASGITENMLNRSIKFEGDTSRLAAKLKEAYNPDGGKKITKVAFLGDSITAGSGADNSANSFANKVFAWFTENINEFSKPVNAGIGATDSYLGVHRVDKDVIAQDPDFIFIEFINDCADDQFYKATMDSLVRKCLAAPTQPAVVLVEMSLKGGGNCQDQHMVAAEAYNVPLLSYHDAITPEINAGNFSFDDISGDGTHPNDIGHGWVADIIINFLEKVQADADNAAEPTAFDPATPSPTGDKYKNATIFDAENGDMTVNMDENWDQQSTPWNFKNGWSTADGGTITFEMEFKNLGMMYYKSTKGDAGIVTVNIDGEDVKQVDGDFTGGWGSYGTNVEVYTSDETAKHTVTVTVNEGERQYFEVLAWLVS